MCLKYFNPTILFDLIQTLRNTEISTFYSKNQASSIIYNHKQQVPRLKLNEFDLNNQCLMSALTSKMAQAKFKLFCCMSVLPFVTK